MEGFGDHGHVGVTSPPASEDGRAGMGPWVGSWLGHKVGPPGLELGNQRQIFHRCKLKKLTVVVHQKYEVAGSLPGELLIAPARLLVQLQVAVGIARHRLLQVVQR